MLTISAEYYWAEVANRKQVLLDFAAHYQFDPLVAANWYQAPLHDLYEVFLFLFGFFSYLFKLLLFFLKMYPQKSRSMLNFYGNSVTRALVHLFPDIGLRSHLFSNLSRKPLFFLFIFPVCYQIYFIAYSVDSQVLD